MIQDQVSIYSAINHSNKIKDEVQKYKKLKSDFNPKYICSMKQTHSTNIRQISKLSQSQVYKNTDGLITDRKDVCLVIKTADCIPLIISNKNKDFVLAAHLGWKGLYQGFIKKIFKKVKAYSKNPQEIHAYLGPSIRSCCYFFPEKPIQSDKKVWKKNITQKSSNWHINLQGFLIERLKNHGIEKHNIYDAKTCTYHDNLPSYKRDKDKSEPLASLLTIVQLKP